MGIELYPYLSPTGAGMTSSKELAERMEQLRLEYIEACEKSKLAHKRRIQDEERELVVLIHDEKVKVERETRQRVERQENMPPRFIRITVSAPSKRDTGRGFQETIWHDEQVCLDLNEVEMTVIMGLQFKIMMKSGRELIVMESDFNRVEKAWRERQS